jgi:addiction module HigA family antidote
MVSIVSVSIVAAITPKTSRLLTIMISGVLLDFLYSVAENTEQEFCMTEYIDLDHIGKILQEEFMAPCKLSQNALAKAIDVAPSRITDIVNGRRTITADTDLRLTRLFGLSEGYFLRIQEHRETALARHKIQGELEKIVPLKAKSA